MFKSDKDRAVAYAAFTTLKRMLEKDGDLPPGFYQDVTGDTLTITFPKGSVVERDVGTNGDGTINKKAVQNLYGYATWAFLIQRLKKFKQWNSVKEHIVAALAESVKRPTKNVKDELTKEMPEIVDIIEALKTELKIPTREEDTPRLFKESGLPATIVINTK